MSAGFDVVDALAGLSEDLRSEGEFVSRIHDAVEKLKQERDEATDSALMFERDWKDACRERDEARAEVERLSDASTHWQVMLKREMEEVERLRRELPVHPSNLTDVVSLLEDERDELLVRVANQDAELRATRDAYIDAKWTNAYRRGAEAMREACASAMRPIMRSMISRTEAAQTIRALPIPEEP